MYNLHNFFEVKIIKPKGEEITTRAYNLVTDFGKEQVMKGVSMSRYIDLGRGTTQPQPTDTTLGSRLITREGSVSSSWNPGRDTLTYTIVNVMDESVLPNTDFTEIGISSSSSGGSLWTKALFTDSQGQPTSVRKGPLDRMEVRAIVYISIPATPTTNLQPAMAHNVLRRLSEGVSMQSLIKHSFSGIGKVGNNLIGFPGTHQEIWTGASYETATKKTKATTDWTSNLQGGWANCAAIMGIFSNGNLGTRAGSLYIDPFAEQPINTFPIGTGDGSTKSFPIFYTVSNKDSIKVKVNGAEKVKGTDYDIEYLGALPLQGGNISDNGSSSKYDTQVFLPKEAGATNRSFVGGFIGTDGRNYTNSDYTVYALSTPCITLNEEKTGVVSQTTYMAPSGTCRMGTGHSGSGAWGAVQFGKYTIFMGDSDDQQWKVFVRESDTVTNAYPIKPASGRRDSVIPTYPIPRSFNDHTKGFVSLFGSLNWDESFGGYTWDEMNYQYGYSVIASSSVQDFVAFEKGTVRTIVKRGANFLTGTMSNHFTERTLDYKANGITGGTGDLDLIWYDLDTKNYLRWNAGNNRIDAGKCKVSGNSIVNDGDPITIGTLPSNSRDLAYRAVLARTTPTSFVISAVAPTESYSNRPFEYLIEVPDTTTAWNLETLAANSKVTYGHNRTGSVLRIQSGIVRMAHPVLDTGSHIMMSNGSVWLKGLYKVVFKDGQAPEQDSAITVDFSTDTFRKDESWRFTASGSVGFDT